MIWIDIVLIIIILWFAFKGFKRGLVVELSILISLVLAIWGAVKYKSVVAGLLTQYIGLQGSYVSFVAFVITFLLILIVVSLLGRMLTKLIGVVQLGILNRLLGTLFAVAKIGIILSLLVNGLDRLNNEMHFIKETSIEKSILYKPLNKFAEKIYDFSDKHYDEVKGKIEETLEDIENTTA